MDDELRKAVFQSDPKDRKMIRQYIIWMRVRRRINQFFYKLPIHWVKPSRRYHWVGR